MLGTAALLAPNLLAGCSQSKKNIGLQLYSLRGMINEQGIQAALQAVAEIGYMNLETASYKDGQIYGLAAEDFKKRITDLGLICTSAHIGQVYNPDDEQGVWDWWKKAAEVHAQIGAKYLVMPWMPVNENSSLDELRTYCDYFNKVGEIAQKSGLRFGYHNHAGEFKKIEDQVMYDFMLAKTDPATMGFQLDVYWCQVGGANPVEYLKRFPEQIFLTHIKDEKEIGASGMMDFESIFNQMKTNGIKDWYVEVERYTNDNDLESVRQSFEFLNAAAYVK